MNRHERRANAAKVRSSKLEQVAAIHESGHAVARVLVAIEAGDPINEAVSHIEIGMGQQLGRSLNTQAELYSMATTYGPWLPPIAEAFVMSLGLKSGDTPSFKQLQEAIHAAKRAGVDVKAWAAGRVFHTAAGAAAEAQFTRQTFDAIWNSYACEGDLSAANRDCIIAGLDESVGPDFISEHASRAVAAMKRADVWCAVLALADRLPNHGKMAGSTAIAIIQRALQDHPAAANGLTGADC
jgi:hypothetical protein